MQITGTIERTMKVRRSPRVLQVEGKYDLAPAASETATWNIDITLPEKYSVGVIVGASGSGKTTVARLLAEKLVAVLQTPRDEKGALVEPYVWGADTAVIEEIAGREGSAEDAMMLLSSVGFASAPAWRRPFHVLSFGQQFRATLARTLAEAVVDKKPRMVDEYSSVIDRTVAKVGSAAVARTVRRYGCQFIAVTCHHDVIDWLEPDWVITCHDDRRVTIEYATQPPENVGEGESVVPTRRWVRPRIDIRIAQATDEAWARFAPHHYLDHDLHRSAMPFIATIDGEAVGFVGVIHYPQQKYGLTYREHRVVVLPDYQGVGIGNRISEAVAACFKTTGYPYFSLTSHPAMIAHRRKSPLWRMTRRGVGTSNGSTGLTKGDGKRRRTSRNRLTAAFEYVGEPDERGAERLGVKKLCQNRESAKDGSAIPQRAKVG